MTRTMRFYLAGVALLFSLLTPKVTHAQDTLYFHDGSYSVGKLFLPDTKKIHFLQFAENGDSALKSERAADLDSVHFHNSLRYVKGSADTTALPSGWKPFAAYFYGMKAGEKNTSISKSFVATGYVSGLLVAGLPYTLYKAAQKPSVQDIPGAESALYQRNPDFALGYRKGMKHTRLKAILPVYVAGILTSMLGLAILLPR